MNKSVLEEVKYFGWHIAYLAFAAFLFSLLVPSASATLESLKPYNVVYYAGDNDTVTASSVFDLAGYQVNATPSAAAMINQSGFILEGFQHTAANYLSFSTSAGIFKNNTVSRTGCVAFRSNSTTANQGLLTSESGDGCFYLGTGGVFGTDNVIDVSAYTGSGWIQVYWSMHDTSSWHTACYSWDRDNQNLTVWGDGVYRNSTALATTAHRGTPYVPSVGSVTLGAALWQGHTDEVAFWNVTLTAAEILEYHSQVQNPYRGGTPAPTISITSLQNGTRFNSTDSEGVNITLKGTGSLFVNCSLWRKPQGEAWFPQYTFNFTDLELNYSDTNFSGTTENNFTYKANCTDGTETAKNITVNVDNQQPSIVVSQTLSSNTLSAYPGQTFTAWVNVSDPELYALNITVNGTIIFNVSGITVPKYNYSLTVDPAVLGLGVGVHTLLVEASDSHTGMKIKPLKVQKNLATKELRFEDGPGFVKIVPDDPLEYSGFGYADLVDRQEFSYSKSVFHQPNKGMVFDVVASGRIDIIQGSGYRGHLVVPSLERWIDFETGDEAKVKVKRKAWNHVEVSVKNTISDEVVFRSIGGLNKNSASYTFYYGNVSDLSPVFAVENETVQFRLEVYKKAGYVNGSSANISVNGSFYAVSKTSNSSVDIFLSNVKTNLIKGSGYNINISHNWTFDVELAVGSNYSNQTANMNTTIGKMVVDNCSLSYTERYINYTTKDLDTGAHINSDMSSSLVLWRTEKVYNRTYSVGFASNATPTVCVYPPLSWFYADYQTIFEASGYNPGSVASNQENFSTSNAYAQTVYLTNTTKSSYIQIQVVDERDEPLSNHLVEAYEYDVGNNSYTFVSSKTSNSYGFTLFSLTANTKEYQFKVYNESSDLIHTEPRTFLTTDGYVVRIRLRSTTELVVADLSTFFYSLTSSRAGRNFTAVWNDQQGVVDSVRFLVLNVTTNSSAVLYDVWSSAVSGALNYTLSPGANGTFSAFLYANATANGDTYLLDSKSETYNPAHVVFGAETLIYTLLIVGVVIFALYAVQPALGIIAGVLGMVISFFAGFMIVSGASLVGVIVASILVAAGVRRQ